MAKSWYSPYISHCHGCYRWLWLGSDIPHTSVIVMTAIVDCGKVLIFPIHQSLSWLLSLIVARFWYSSYISHCLCCYRWLWQGSDIPHTSVIVMTAIVDYGKVLIFPIHQSLSCLLSLIVARLWYYSYISHCLCCYRWLWQGSDIAHTSVIVVTAIVDCGKVLIFPIHQSLSLLLSLIVARFWYSPYISHCLWCYRWLWQGSDIPHTSVIVMTAIVDCGKVLIFPIHLSLSLLLSLIVARFWYSPYISHCHGCYRWLGQGYDIPHTSVFVMTAIVDCG